MSGVRKFTIGTTQPAASTSSASTRPFDQRELQRIGQFSLRQASCRLQVLAAVAGSGQLHGQLLLLSSQLERQAQQLGAGRDSQQLAGQATAVRAARVTSIAPPAARRRGSAPKVRMDLTPEAFDARPRRARVR